MSQSLLSQSHIILRLNVRVITFCLCLLILVRHVPIMCLKLNVSNQHLTAPQRTR